MLFNSIDFAIFLPVVFLIYWLVVNRNVQIQNTFLLVASYFFYGCWDWHFLFLISLSSFVDFFVGLGLGRTVDEKKRKLLLLTSVVVNIGILAFFKYYNFFAENFAMAFSLFGTPVGQGRLNIILPVGISFYTFQSLSYSIDNYRRKIEPSRNIVEYFTFVSFFPQLVAGPIERAVSLLPQFHKKRSFDYDQAVDGMRQILWGLFKKVVIADNCAKTVDVIFANYNDYSGSTLLLGGVLFAIQIYGDFSGYSDIAIGASRLFGFNIMRNFAYPYFSRDIGEFWRRWHISLTTWFRDYVYIPLGGSKCGPWKNVSNIFVIFLVSGFWHGANWTFIVWGFVNACYFLPLTFLKLNRRYTDDIAKGRLFPTVKEAFEMSATFLLVVISWVFFRSETIEGAVSYIANIFKRDLFTIPTILPFEEMIFIALCLSVEWFQRDKQHALQFKNVTIPKAARWGIYLGIVALIFRFGADRQEFIYFQF